MGTGTHRLAIAGRALLVLAAAALAWSAAVALTGGFVVEIGPVRISSRNATRPLVVGVALLVLYVVKFGEELRRGAWTNRVSPVACAATVAVLVTATGLLLTTRVAAGPDASGFVSQAVMFTEGRLTRAAPAWIAAAPWPGAALSASPIGYRPALRADVLAPTYPPGLSLLMAGAHVLGGLPAVFLVVPLLGGVAVYGTFVLGRRLAGPWEGLAAAALLAASPPFLTMLLQPMSDVPATAAWVVALAAALHGRPAAAGLATTLAVLIRPNLVPAAIIPAAILLADARRLRPVVVFGLAVAPAAVAIGALNWFYYGSPLQSGYGALSYLYSADRIVPNAVQYGGWLLFTQTPLVFLWLLAPFMRAQAPRTLWLLTTVGFPAAVIALYLPYFTFQPFEWWYLRFLMPAYPAAFVAIAAAILAGTRRMPVPSFRIAAALLLVGAVAVYGIRLTNRFEMFDRAQGDRRFARAVAFVERLPPDAVILSLSHSGTISFYTGRDVLRFEALAPGALDAAVAYLRGLGRRVYFVGDTFEVEMLREQFRGSAALAALDAGPLADLAGAVVYEM